MLLAASKMVAKELGKPEGYVQIVLRCETPMCFGGDADSPTAACTLSSIGAIGGDKNKVRPQNMASTCSEAKCGMRVIDVFPAGNFQGPVRAP